MRTVPRLYHMLRRRRMLMIIVISCLAFIVLTSVGFTGNLGQSSLDALDNSDYDLSYDSVDGVHAMVRQMSSVKRSRLHDFVDNPTADQKNPDQYDLKYISSKKRKLRLGIGDYPDIPDNVPKKYSFINQPKTDPFPHEVTPKPHEETNLDRANDDSHGNEDDEEEDDSAKVRINVENELPVHGMNNRDSDVYNMVQLNKVQVNEKLVNMEGNRIIDKIDNAEEEDSYEYNEEDKEAEIIINNDQEEDEQYDEDYDDINPNPVFKRGDFDPMPKNATKKKAFQFQELSAEDRVPQQQYSDNLPYDGDDYGAHNGDQNEALEDSRVNGRMLHSKLQAHVHGLNDIDRALGNEPMDALVIKHNQDSKHYGRHVNIHDDNSQRKPQMDMRNLNFNQGMMNRINNHNTQKRVTRTNITHMINKHKLQDSPDIHDYHIDLKYHPAQADRTNYNNNHDNNVPNVDARFIHKNIQNVIQTPPSAIANEPMEQPATQIQTPKLPQQPQGPLVFSKQGYPIIEDNIYWSQKAESFVPKGLGDRDVDSFLYRVRHLAVDKMYSPQWNRCGRPKNQYIVLTDGTTMCARYRDPHNKFIHGEVLSFYLSQMLGLDAVPAVALAKINTSAPQWRGQNITAAQWSQGQMVAMIQWIDGLDEARSRVKMPSVILNAYETGESLNRNHAALVSMTTSELSELIQWSDMILFDYITGHYDRFASMQDGADREQRPSILAESVRNLRKVPNTGKMWLIDNESGFLDSYELLYRGRKMGQKFVDFHRKMLHTLCIFRKSTVQKIHKLASNSSPDELLLAFAYKGEPLLEQMPRTAEYKLFKGYFHTRLKQIQSWIDQCQRQSKL